MGSAYAIAGKILDVDLSAGRIWTEATGTLAERFMGGLGIGTYEALVGMERGARPFDPESVVVFSAGTLVGTLAPMGSRLSINGLNAHTGGFGSTSAGGAFAPEMKFAGYDNIVVKGRAPKPVYLLVDDDRVSIEDAGFLWGRTVGETVDLLQARHADPQLQVLAIGPAGERRLKAANVIVSRSRAAGRCGLGAVMGAKQLKAIAVRGTGGVLVSDPRSFTEACRAVTRKIATTTTPHALRRYGTPVSFTKWNELSAVPVRNFQRTQMELARAAHLSADRFRHDHIRRVFACRTCTSPCSQYAAVTSGDYAGISGEKIESQNLWDFGAKLDVESLPAVLEASRLCTEYGLDVTGASGVIAWAFECWQKGLLTAADTGGLELTWGNHRAVVELVRKMAYEEDAIGKLLARGQRDAAASLGHGSAHWAMHVKGQDLAEELRPFKGWALGCAVAERGGTHTVGSPLTERMDLDEATSMALFGTPTAGQPAAYDGKAALVVYYQRFHAAMEGIGVCFFASNWMGPAMPGPADFVELYNLATGKRLSTEDFMRLGERLHTLQKLVNVKFADFTRADDYPQARFFEEGASGTAAGERLDRERWGHMLDEYYALHGWDIATGRPTPACLADNGLAEFTSLLT